MPVILSVLHMTGVWYSGVSLKKTAFCSDPTPNAQAKGIHSVMKR